jgi:hypothetical protein
MAGGVYDHRGRGLPSTSISEKCGVAVETFLRVEWTGRKGDRCRLRHSQVRRRFAGLKNWKTVGDGDVVAIGSCSATALKMSILRKGTFFDRQDGAWSREMAWQRTWVRKGSISGQITEKERQTPNQCRRHFTICKHAQRRHISLVLDGVVTRYKFSGQANSST